MARHPFGPGAARGARNRTYTLLLAGLLIVMVVAFYYGPFGKNEAEPIDEGLPSEVNIVAETPKVEQPAPTVAPSTLASISFGASAFPGTRR